MIDNSGCRTKLNPIVFTLNSFSEEKGLLSKNPGTITWGPLQEDNLGKEKGLWGAQKLVLEDAT